MIGISISKLITLFLIMYFVLKFFKSLSALAERKTKKTEYKKSEGVVNLKKGKDGKYR